MAFSYSDENFTVIGNLCFVHIVLYGAEKMIDIPPAIAERILNYITISTYTYYSSKEARGVPMPSIGYASINDSKIYLSDAGPGYLSFYFPIDSNK